MQAFSSVFDTYRDATLTEFRKRGGKLLIFHGTADPIFSALESIDYYQRLTRNNGGPEMTSTWARLFLVPGMVYTTSDYGGGNREFRSIPTDDRKHDPKKAIEATYNGYTVGRWEGDTLVLDSISFVDTTWFGRGGLFHSANLHIVEKFTRTGNEMRYEITLEDPDVLVEPWVMAPRTLRLNRAPDAGIVPERAYCEVYEEGNVTTQLRH